MEKYDKVHKILIITKNGQINILLLLLIIVYEHIQ